MTTPVCAEIGSRVAQILVSFLCMWAALDVLFPPSCHGCGELPANDRPWCDVCWSAFALHAIPLRIEGLRAAYAAAHYRSAIGQALVRAKYGRDLRAMILLGRPFARLLAPIAIGADAIVAAPSPWTRRAIRGFSAASVLASALAEASEVPLVDALVLRHGARQAGMRGAGRSKNLRGRLYARHDVAGRVILVDDVVTTGATAAAAARELLAVGATDVTLATLTSASSVPSLLREDP